MNADPDGKRELLRHTLATLAYRGAKVLRGAPADFATRRRVESGRTPLEILAHIGDLLDWALSTAEGAQVWRESQPQTWEREEARFFAALQALEDRLAADTPLGGPPEKLFQGPIADALTHVGQIALLRRAAGAPVRGESYYQADIVAGRVGPDQAPAPREFD